MNVKSLIYIYVLQVRLGGRIGSVAEWSKALVLGTSLLGGVGSNPTTARNFVEICLLWE